MKQAQRPVRSSAWGQWVCAWRAQQGGQACQLGGLFLFTWGRVDRSCVQLTIVYAIAKPTGPLLLLAPIPTHSLAHNAPLAAMAACKSATAVLQQLSWQHRAPGRLGALPAAAPARRRLLPSPQHQRQRQQRLEPCHVWPFDLAWGISVDMQSVWDKLPQNLFALSLFPCELGGVGWEVLAACLPACLLRCSWMADCRVGGLAGILDCITGWWYGDLKWADAVLLASHIPSPLAFTAPPCPADLGFLYHLTRSKQTPPLTLFGFYFLLVFVGKC